MCTIQREWSFDTHLKIQIHNENSFPPLQMYTHSKFFLLLLQNANLASIFLGTLDPFCSQPLEYQIETNTRLRLGNSETFNYATFEIFRTTVFSKSTFSHQMLKTKSIPFQNSTNFDHSSYEKVLCIFSVFFFWWMVILLFLIKSKLNVNLTTWITSKAGGN